LTNSNPQRGIDFGVQLVGAVGTDWLAIAGDNFWKRWEFVLNLTGELGPLWLLIFVCIGETGPASAADVAATLRMDLDAVDSCVKRLAEKGLLVEEIPPGEGYAVVGRSGRSKA
jgi:hypothetical protein